MFDLDVLATFIFYIISLFFTVWVVGRVNDAGKLFCFFLLFYSIAPIIEFENFTFFLYSVEYKRSSVVLIIYSSLLLLGGFITLKLFSQEIIIDDLFPKRSSEGLKILWYIALFAWGVDLTMNWSFMFLPKEQYILSIPSQTKNLFFFTIPARELLAGAIVFCPFKGRSIRAICIVVGLLATVHSLTIGVRHVAVLVILMCLLTRVDLFGFLLLCFSFTFVGEFSIFVKLALLPGSGIQEVIFDYQWWFDNLFNNFGVSTEQKAILSNLLLKLEYLGMLDFKEMFLEIATALPFVQLLASHLGVTFTSIEKNISSFVGASDGEGTAYSLHLSVIESYGLILIFVILALVLARKVRGSMIFILAGEIMFSMMRNGPNYWIVQLNKLIFLIIFVFLFSKTAESVKDMYSRYSK